jgi:beta-barrel assembly-enhancing protease
MRHRILAMFRLRNTELAFVLFVLLAMPALAQGPTQIRPGFNFFSKQQDVQLGQEAAAQVRKQLTVIKDPTLTAYVNAVGQRLMASQEAKASGFPFTFEVVADPSINAFALPGGPMFINTGLLRAVDNEAQLAAVMGHEMSHVILRHGTNQASKANLIELPAALAGELAGNGSMMGQLAQLGIGFGANSVLLKFSRTAESQADLMGSHLMAEAGYDPLEMAKFFEKLNANGGSSAFQFLSDHPNPGNREKAIEQEAARLPEQTYGYQTGKFQQMKKVVATIHEPPPKPQPAQ